MRSLAGSFAQEVPGTLAQRMHELLGGYRTTQMLFVAARLGLADQLAAGPRTVEQLAEATGAHAGALARLLRALASQGLFAERPDGSFELTPLAGTLRSDLEGSLRPFALSYGEGWWWDAFAELLHSVQTGQAGFARAHGMGLFEYLDRHPDAAAVFNGNMTAMTLREAQEIVDGYDFSGLGRLVDVGGGQGALAAAVLACNPRAEAVLFDQPSVIDGVAARLERLGVAGRCRLEGGSFFDAVTPGGDLYTLKDVLHDWDDSQCAKILASVRRAMPGHARVLVIQRPIPPGNGPSPGKLVDITMLVMTGGMERTEAQYRRLLEAAGLGIHRVIPLPSGTSVIEAAAS